MLHYESMRIQMIGESTSRCGNNSKGISAGLPNWKVISERHELKMIYL
jgi:hypothetical protein